MDHVTVAAVLSEFIHSLASDQDGDEVLRRLQSAAVELLDVDGAGVMVAEGDRTRFVGGSSRAVSRLERAQEELQEGPCRDALHTGQTVVVPDLADTASWPHYRARALGDGWHAAASVPVIGQGRIWGLLDLYRCSPGGFPPEELALAATLADIAASHLVMAHDRQAAANVHRELAHRALHDDLTGLPNRALLTDRLEHELAVAHRHRTPLAVLFLDLDRFKDVNDTLGHPAGDELLVHVARRLAAAIRAPDTVARIGGDEFVVLCTDVPDSPRGSRLEGQLTGLADRLARAVSSPIRLGAEEVVVGVSIGAVIARPEHRDAQALLREADAAMYAVKRRRAPFTVVDLRDPGDAQERLRTARELRSALRAGQLQVHYQPVVALQGQPEQHVEALVRWVHPDRGLLAAADFLPVAETVGLMVDIGRVVLDQACRFATVWRPAVERSTVAVNVSGTEVLAPGFVERTMRVVAEHRLDPRRLRLELTENVLLDRGPRIGRVLRRLREAGIALSLDDFGTGYSSLSHLERFPVDALKIDRTFVARLKDARGGGIVAGVVGLARGLGLDIVAEGVEHPTQLERVRELGCSYGQGLLLGAPVPAEVVLSA